MTTTATEGAMAAREEERAMTPADGPSAENAAATGHPAASELALKDLGLSTRWLNLLLGAGLESAQDLLDLLARGDDALLEISGIGDKALEEVQERLAALGLLDNRHAGGDTGREQEGAGVAERNTNQELRATEQKREAMEEQVANTEPATSAQSEKAEELPISFALRLAVDEQGRPLRTEIEPTKKEIKSGKFQGLDGDELVSYIEEYIRNVITPEARLSPVAPPAEAAAQRPEYRITEPFLAISDVRVLRAGVASLMPPPIGAGQAFRLQVRFHLRGPGIASIAAQQPSYRIEVYAIPVGGTGGSMVATRRAKLKQEGTDYVVQIRVPALSAGTHFLHTVIAIYKPTKLLAHHEGPSIRVTGAQPESLPTTPTEIVLSG